MKKILLLSCGILFCLMNQAQIIYTAAGGGNFGNGGLATDASFSIDNTAIDAHGNIYIADYNNNQIRKISSTTGIISTIAGTGEIGFNGDGIIATSAQLNTPSGVCVDVSGNIYFADKGNQRVRKVNAITGIITTVAGNGVNGYGGDDSIATKANLYSPTDVAVDVSGNIYIADYDNNIIRKVSISTNKINTIVGSYGRPRGFGGDGSLATAASINYPTGIAIDSIGNLYIVDSYNNRIRKVSASSGIISTVAGSGTGTGSYAGDGGPAVFAKLDSPKRATLDAQGNLYIADRWNARIRKVSSSTGIISTVAGNGFIGYGGDSGAAIMAKLYFPQGISFDSTGNMYIADNGNNNIRKVDNITGIITTIAGNGSVAGAGDGNLAILANLYKPFGTAIDSLGNIYIADAGNNRIRKISSINGTISTVAGNGGVANVANLKYPSGVCIDDSGNLYIADQKNNQIRKVAASTGIITTIAGNGNGGYSGDGGMANLASLYYPNGVAVDDSGNIYIADLYNQRIRKVTANTGIISTVAGNGSFGYGGDGGIATSAKLNFPYGLALDKNRNIYIADQTNQRIRKVNAITGIISTVAGNGSIGFGGEGGAATSAMLNYPVGVAIDTSGNLYIADSYNNKIRKVAANTGIITTIIGNGTAGYGGDGGLSTSAFLSTPTGIAVGKSGDICVVDFGNNRIRKVIYRVANNSINGNQVICLGSAPDSIIGNIPIGGIGTYSYTWLKSTISATTGFTAIPSSNYINYRPSTLTQNTWFRRYVVSGTYADTSTATLITVNNPISSNTIISVSQPVCTGSTIITFASQPNGGNGIDYNYNWLVSYTNASSGFSSIPSSNIQNYTASGISQNAWFKRVVTSGACAADTSAAIAITIIPAIANNAITSAAQTICTGSTPSALQGSTPTGSNGIYSYSWLKSISNASTGFTATGVNDTLLNYAPNALSQNTWFKRIVSYGFCKDTSSAISITINNPITSNTITGAVQTICSGSAPFAIAASNPSGGNGTTFNYKWISSITNDTTDFTKAGANDSSNNYNPNVLTQNTWFKRIVSSGVCNADTSGAIAITVNQQIATNTITSGGQSICLGSTPAQISASNPSGGDGLNYTYSWLRSTTNSISGFLAITSSNSQNYIPSSLTQNTWFKRKVLSGVCKADTSAAILISINQKPKVGFTINNPIQCLKGNSFLLKDTTTSTASRIWYLGDLTTNTNGNFNKTYTNDGTYTISLKATDANNCSDSIIKLVTVKPSPRVGYTVNNPTQCLIGNSFSFDDTTSSVISRIWNLGDLTTNTNGNFGKTYTNDGTYTISLKVTDANNCSDSIIKLVTVKPSPRVGYTVNNPIQCFMGNSFSFDDTTSTVTSRIWNLGDLTSNTNDTFSKSYINAGTYNVTLKVTNAYNCADSIIKTINVKANPVQPTISAVSNSELTSTTANAYQWYKDGNVLNGATNQTLLLTSNGSFTVKIDSSNLCSNLSNPFIATTVSVNEMVSEKEIKIYPNPAINELHIVTQGSEKFSVQLFDFTGKEASEHIVFSHSTDINTQLLSEGMYFVKISDANGAAIKTEKVMVNR